MSELLVRLIDIEAIFDKPGARWSEKERDAFDRWLFKSQQEYMLNLAFRLLGDLATPENAEDIWTDFYIKRLKSVIETYDPAKGRRFQGWLMMCFRQFCSYKRDRLRRQYWRERQLIEEGVQKRGDIVRR